uniref:Zinc transporter ZIP9-like n=1 Tax=Hirondellea gigas TaxID=1518452 RepID=A0A6A7G1Z3_9CRUS
MEAVVELILMSIAMFVGCYIAGKLPLILQNRESKNQLMSVFGAGMLVGTAFAVIIPEGIRMLYINCNQPSEPSMTQPELLLREGGEAEAKQEHEHTHEGERNNELTIALSLLLGFLLMLLVDKCSATHHASTRSDSDSQGVGIINGGTSTSSSRKMCTATLGLVVHAAADGIALGAAVGSHHSDVEFIVFFAIMLHKAPTAFGLTSFLVREGSDYRRINKMLLVFSAAAPLGSFLTFAIINAAGSQSVSSSTHSSSVAMLFSAGTFIYVATVHIIPELMSGSSGSESSETGAGQLSWLQLLTMIIGAFVPVLFSIGHHH